MRFLKQLLALLLFPLIDCNTLAQNSNHSLDYLFPSRTVYFGVNMGGGSTEWKYLVDTTDQDNAGQNSLPSAVNEGGPSWGVVFGFDVAKNFAIELQYMQFADANIQFLPSSAYFNSAGVQIFNIVSKTDAYSLSGKFFVPIGFKPTHLRAFAAIGAGIVERHDALVNENPNSASGLPPSGDGTASCVTPYMSSGLDYNFTRHWIMEGGFQYYTGFGASEVDPVDSFIPFAWDAYGRLAYQL